MLVPLLLIVCLYAPNSCEASSCAARRGGAQTLGIFDGFGEAIVNFGEDVVDKVTGGVTDTADAAGISDLFTDGKPNQKFKDLVNKAVGDVISEIEQGIEEGQRIIDERGSKIESLAKDITMEVENAVGLIVDYTEDTWNKIPAECKNGFTEVFDKAKGFGEECADVIRAVPDFVNFVGDPTELRSMCVAVKESFECYDAREALEDTIRLQAAECDTALGLNKLPSTQCTQELINLRDTSSMFLTRHIFMDVLCTENPLKENGETCIETMVSFGRDHSDNFKGCLDEMFGGFLGIECSEECTALALQLQEDAGCCLTGFQYTQHVLDLIDGLGAGGVTSACGVEMFSCPALNDTLYSMKSFDLPLATNTGLSPEAELARFPNGNDAFIVDTRAIVAERQQENGGNAGTTDSGGLSGGAAAGIAFTVIILVGAAVGAAYWYFYRRPQKPVVVISDYNKNNSAAPSTISGPTPTFGGGANPSENSHANTPSRSFPGPPPRPSHSSIGVTPAAAANPAPSLPVAGRRSMPPPVPLGAQRSAPPQHVSRTPNLSPVTHNVQVPGRQFTPLGSSRPAPPAPGPRVASRPPPPGPRTPNLSPITHNVTPPPTYTGSSTSSYMSRTQPMARSPGAAPVNSRPGMSKLPPGGRVQDRAAFLNNVTTHNY